MTNNVTPIQELRRLWQNLGRSFELDDDALNRIHLPTQQPLFSSSFHVDTAAQVSIGMAALSAAEIWAQRTGQQQQVSVSSADAEAECTAYFTLDGKQPQAWEKYSGLYATGDGHVRLHANFDHHRDGALALLGFTDPNNKPSREDVEQAFLSWSAQDFETAAAGQNLVATKVRSFSEWDQHPHAHAIHGLPLLSISRIGDAPPQPLGKISTRDRPLAGLKVIELTRILAGPICGRTLAAYGAQVMLVNAPHLPNIAAVSDTSRGKLSCHLDLRRQNDKGIMLDLLRQARVFVQGYRPGGLAKLGFSPGEVAEQCPGLIYVGLSAYGSTGPWQDRRGFDSLVQTATGFNHAEGLAAQHSVPKTLPLPILDYASGFLMAFGAQAALAKQATQGGSWQVQVSLLQTANWLRSLGRRAWPTQHNSKSKEVAESLLEYPCTHGLLHAMPHAAKFSHTQVLWQQPSALPGTHPANW